MESTEAAKDERAIRRLVENWAIWRDARMWDRFRTVWHDDGRMMATWFQGSADDFIRVSEEGYARGVRILHFLGGMSVDLAGARAIAQTKMTISQRAAVEGVVCDVVCTGQFYDFFEQRDGRWGLVLRQPIMKRTGSIPWIRRRGSNSTKTCWRGFRKATGTSPICRPGSATRSRPTCRALMAPNSMRFIVAARRGLRGSAWAEGPNPSGIMLWAARPRLSRASTSYLRRPYVVTRTCRP